MFHFNDAVAELLGSLQGGNMDVNVQAVPITELEDDTFQSFKEFTKNSDW